MTVVPSLADTLLSFLVFGLLIMWVILTVIQISRRVKTWLGNAKPSLNVEQTVNQMYGDVHVQRDYAATRNAKQSIMKGAPNGKAKGH